MKMTVVIEYYGNVHHVVGPVMRRAVSIELTPEQSAALSLHPDEYYGPIAFQAAQPAQESE